MIKIKRLKKGTTIYSILKNRCPRCQEGKVFEVDNAYDLKNFDKMKKSCEICGEVYEKETGYFYGAMFVSYGYMAAWFALTFLPYYLLTNIPFIYYIVFIVVSTFVLMPLTYRISRLSWLNIFVHYNEKTKRL